MASQAGSSTIGTLTCPTSAVTATTVECQVPEGAQTGPLTVRVANAGEIQASVARALDEGIQALVVAICLQVLSGETLILGGWLPRWLERVLVALAWLWFINLFNFMDGIDGITGTWSA